MSDANELARLRAAIAEKGGTEHYPTLDAYLSACDALTTHKYRAEKAEVERDEYKKLYESGTKFWNPVYEKILVERDAARSEASQWRDELARARDEVQAYRAEVERLRAFRTLVERHMPRARHDERHGPCCSELYDGRWVMSSCTCGQYDDSAEAGEWRMRANFWLEADRLATGQNKEVKPAMTTDPFYPPAPLLLQAIGNLCKAERFEAAFRYTEALEELLEARTLIEDLIENFDARLTYNKESTASIQSGEYDAERRE